MPWRSTSLTNLAISDGLRKKSSVLESSPKTTFRSRDDSSLDNFTPDKRSLTPDVIPWKDKGVGHTIVTIVIVEAKGLPNAPYDSAAQGIYCRFRCGGRLFRTKPVLNTRHPQWRERFKLSLCKDQSLQVSLWHKGNQKVFMGSCVLDMSQYERERTHDIWSPLDDGYGDIHLSVTLCNTRNVDGDAGCTPNVDEIRQKYAFNKLNSNLEVIGQLIVKVIGAKGLHGKPNAYCSLELDNERVRTPSVDNCAEPTWNKTYMFNVYDVTSVLDLKVVDNSLNTFFVNDFLGRVSIPLLRVTEGEARWYALKDSAMRRCARGNCPRIRLEISMYWNPVTASLRLFRPKQVKYIEKPPKFDLSLVYKNLKFIRDTFEFLKKINVYIKRSFEWDDRKYASMMLLAWLAFCSTFALWMLPLFILLPFFYFWYYEQKQHDELDMSDDAPTNMGQDHNIETLGDKVQGLPEMTIIITQGIEYLVSVAERIFNLVSFKVPFLSWLTMILLVVASVVLYYVPFRFLMMALGIYKFIRKQINPERVLNNDLLDFISRIPDNKILKDWRELSVPEPYQSQRSHKVGTTSTSSRAFS